MSSYGGFVIPQQSSSSWEIDRVCIGEITPRQFFTRFIVQRKPCILIGALPDAEWKVSSHWNGRQGSDGKTESLNTYLKNRVGNVPVLVEERADATEGFGTGSPKITMPFGELLDSIEKGSDRYYMTTQQSEITSRILPAAKGCGCNNNSDSGDSDDSDEPYLLSSPLLQLRDDFPLRPLLLGGLVPHQINMWIGNNRDGSSTGLHHDFHDNLYVLVRGRKRFTLFSPGDASHLYTRGQIGKIHPNGLINYRGHITRADNAEYVDVMNVAMANAMDGTTKDISVEAVVDALRRRDKKGVTDSMKRRRTKDKNSNPRAASNDDNDKDQEQYEDEDEDEDEDGEGDIVLFGDAEDSESEFDDSADLHDDFDEADFVESDEDEDEDEDEDDESDKKKDDFPSAGAKQKDPDSFCRIDTKTLRKFADEGEPSSEFPLLKNATPAVVFVEEGEMLYLPASWFHEVTSFGSIVDPKRGHMALNYWMQPPDSDRFDAPYADSYWPDWYEKRHHSAASIGKRKTSDSAS